MNGDYFDHAREMRREGRITSDEFSRIYRLRQKGDEEAARREYREILGILARSEAGES